MFETRFATLTVAATAHGVMWFCGVRHLLPWTKKREKEVDELLCKVDGQKLFQV